MESLPCARPWFIPQIYNIALQKLFINWIFNRDKKKNLCYSLFLLRQLHSPIAQAASALSVWKVWWASCNFWGLNNNWGVNETQDCQRFITDKQGAIEALKGQTPFSCWKVMLWAWVKVNWCHSYAGAMFFKSHIAQHVFHGYHW